MTEARKITVIQVFRGMGVEPTPDQSWSVGNRVANMYRIESGGWPPKDNRPKTGGGGSHCFALYPESWHNRIADVVREVVKESGAQRDMFDEG